LALAAVIGMPAVVRAQFITSAAVLGTPTQTITFSQFVAGSTSLPQNVSIDPARPVMLTAPDPNNTPRIYNQDYALGGYFPNDAIFNDSRFCTNGLWNSGRSGYVGFFPGTVGRFTLGAPVQEVGATLNYVPLCSQPSQGSPTMRLLGQGGNVLASYDIDALGRIVTPNQLNAGMFRGAIRQEADVYGVEFAGGFLVLDDLVYVAANVTPPNTTAPEPSALVLLAGGLAVIVAARRRRWRR
ncbi:MAG: PEP-CTERM sorting domain-containing protein, partial [Gemmatimonas sp.]